MRWRFLGAAALLVLSCGDGGPGRDGGPPGDGGPPADGGPGDASGTQPDGAPPGDECAQLATEYRRLMDTLNHCQSAADCRVVHGECGVGTAAGAGACYVYVNASEDIAPLAAVEQQWSTAGCPAGFCNCQPAPMGVCSAGKCGEP